MRTCFVICPLGYPESETRKESNLLLNHVIRPVLEPLGYHVNRADLTPDYRTIPDSISKHIFEDDLVIADLTNSNPNVFYELGKRHAWGGRCIHITQNINTIPFDVRHYRVIEYNLENPESLDDVRRELRLQVDVLQRVRRRFSFSFSPEQIIELTGSTLVIDFHDYKKGHYQLAKELMTRPCQKIFLMQRSSSIILGPEQGWGGEKLFYDSLIEQIEAGTEFIHIVSMEGIIRHINRDHSVFPDAGKAIDRLSIINNYVGIDGPSNTWFLKVIPEKNGDPHLKPDRQARTLLVETENGQIEGLLVSDLGGQQGWFHMKGPKIGTFLSSCYDFYHRCSHLTWSDLSEIKESLGLIGDSTS